MTVVVLTTDELEALLERAARRALTLRDNSGAPFAAANDRLDMLTAAVEEVVANAPVTRPLSQSEAARRLGLSRARTIAPAIKAGVIKTVPNGKRRLIPPSEIERIAEEGIRPASRGSERKRRGPGRYSRTDAAAAAAAVRSLPIPEPDRD